MRALFVPITKIDQETQTVYGTATQEVPDRDGEIFDYLSSKPYVEKWSQYFEEQTGGKSKGNLRAMHKNTSAGVLTDIAFDDTAKRIDVAAHVNDPVEWQKVQDGNYTGFSFSGKVVKRWRDPQNRDLVRYTANPTELSLADLPCVPTATFTMVKIGGATEERSFAMTKKIAARADVTPKEGESKYGDVEYADEKNKKYPLDTKAHVRAALSYWGMPKNRAKYSAKDQGTIGRKIRSAARKFDITVTEKAVLNGDFQKGLYEVGSLANLVESLSWAQRAAEYERETEGDDSDIPDRLRDAVGEVAEILEEMTGEEVAELLERLGVDDEDDSGRASSDIKETTKTANAGTTAMPAATTFEKMSKAHHAKLADLAEHARAVHKVMEAHVAKLAGTEHHPMAKAVHEMLGDHCDKIEGFTNEVGGLSTTEPQKDEATAVSGTEKTAGGTGSNADFAKTLQSIEARLAAAEARATKAEGEAAEFRKTAEELAEAGAALMSQATGSVTVLAVGKEQDTGTVQKTAGGNDTAPTNFREAFKKSFANPEIPGLTSVDRRPALRSFG